MITDSFKNKEVVINKVPQKGKLKLLYEFLILDQLPKSKEMIIEHIWETSYETKYDDRCYRLIRRLKTEFDIHVENSKGGYFIK
jgi:hypothetical protein